MVSSSEKLKVKTALSLSRMLTYEKNTSTYEQALALYSWNAQVSAAFLAPLHIFEVVLRNAIVEAIELKYGVNWFSDSGFFRSLTNPTYGYSQRDNLTKAKNKITKEAKILSTSSVVPELDFKFWEVMLQSSFEQHLWDTHLRIVFPNFPAHLGVKQYRKRIEKAVKEIREFRNRVAHHEPIIKYSLSNKFKLISEFVGFRCKATHEWMLHTQSVTPLIALKAV